MGAFSLIVVINLLNSIMTSLRHAASSLLTNGRNCYLCQLYRPLSANTKNKMASIFLNSTESGGDLLEILARANQQNSSKKSDSKQQQNKRKRNFSVENKSMMETLDLVVNRNKPSLAIFQDITPPPSPVYGKQEETESLADSLKADTIRLDCHELKLLGQYLYWNE